MILKEGTGTIDMRDTMYPSCAKRLTSETWVTPDNSTVYGYVLSGFVQFPNGNKAFKGQYFSLWSLDGEQLTCSGEAFCVTRYGYKGQNVVGGPIEKSGRLCYIDSCSDSLLIYPPRMGDPSLNALYFPAGTNQTHHIHPSIRFGVVASGSGFACIKKNEKEIEIPLTKGLVFCIEEREIHRFRTEENEMVVVAFHPDGDWGPTDHNHTMLNRTYINK